MQGPKVGRIPIKVAFVVFLCIKTFIIAVMIGSLTTPRWVKTQNPIIIVDTLHMLGLSTRDLNFDGSSFKGSLGGCTDGCDNRSYAQEASDWCNSWDDIKNAGDSNCNTSQCLAYESMCVTFYLLAIGGLIYVIFEIASGICILVWSCTMFCSLRSASCYCFNYCCPVAACVLHYIAAIGWLGTTRGNYNGSCSNVPSNGGMLNLCNTDGPGLALFLMLFIPFVSGAFVWLACAAKNVLQLNLNNNMAPGGQMNMMTPAIVYPPSGAPNNMYPQQHTPGQAPPQFNPGYGPPQFNPNPPVDNTGFNPPYPKA